MRQKESSQPDAAAGASPSEDRYADLHVHSSASDGLLSPTEVVALAAGKGFAALSISDHDTVAGLPEGFAAAKKQGIELLAGVELSAYLENSEVHILGYCFDYENEALLSALEQLCADRVRRIEEMIRLLRELGVTLDRSSIDAAAAFGSVGRLHVARALYRHGLVSNVRQAFVKYIGRGKPAYVPRAHIPPGEACRLIRDAGGIPVLAHPSLLDRQSLIPKLVKEGIEGIEAFYSKVTPDVAKHYCRVAKKYGLLVTGGSDCHQGEGGDFLLGAVKLDYKYVQKLKEAVAARSLR
jgi:predicted metal-dependent phosphoesterase TrpH